LTDRQTEVVNVTVDVVLGH